MSWKLKAIVGALVLPLALGVAGCGSDRGGDGVEPAVEDVSITGDDNGGQVELAAGQVLVVTLESNPTTGYSWQVSRINEEVLQQEGPAEFIPESDAIGSGGVEVLSFEAVSTGDSDLQLIYHRPWEEDVEPLEVFSVRVSVR